MSDMQAGPRSDAQQALLRSERVVEQDHVEIRRMLERLRTSTDMRELTDVLGQLVEALALHFLKEEQPQGFFESLAGCLPERRDEIADLQQEHARIKEALGRLCRTVAQPGMNHVAVHAASAGLLQALAEHERREHELAHAASAGDGNA